MKIIIYICIYIHQNTVKQRNNDYKKIAQEMPLLLLKNQLRMKIKSRKKFNDSQHSISISGICTFIYLYIFVYIYTNIYI
jgi:hypothetical protein